jgi:hypothetical protein
MLLFPQIIFADLWMMLLFTQIIEWHFSLSEEFQMKRKRFDFVSSVTTACRANFKYGELRWFICSQCSRRKWRKETTAVQFSKNGFQWVDIKTIQIYKLHNYKRYKF